MRWSGVPASSRSSDAAPRICPVRRNVTEAVGVSDAVSSSSGALIPRNVIDSLQKYISHTGNLSALQELEEANLNEYRKTLHKLFYAQIFNKMYDTTKIGLNITRLNYNPPLASNNKLDINEFNMKVIYIKGVRLSEIGSFMYLFNTAASIIALIEKEYHLENE